MKKPEAIGFSREIDFAKEIEQRFGVKIEWDNNPEYAPVIRYEVVEDALVISGKEKRPDELHAVRQSHVVVGTPVGKFCVDHILARDRKGKEKKDRASFETGDHLAWTCIVIPQVGIVWQTEVDDGLSPWRKALIENRLLEMKPEDRQKLADKYGIVGDLADMDLVISQIMADYPEGEESYTEKAELIADIRGAMHRINKLAASKEYQEIETGKTELFNYQTVYFVDEQLFSKMENVEFPKLLNNMWRSRSQHRFDFLYDMIEAGAKLKTSDLEYLYNLIYSYSLSFIPESAYGDSRYRPVITGVRASQADIVDVVNSDPRSIVRILKERRESSQDMWLMQGDELAMEHYLREYATYLGVLLRDNNWNNDRLIAMLIEAGMPDGEIEREIIAKVAMGDAYNSLYFSPPERPRSDDYLSANTKTWTTNLHFFSMVKLTDGASRINRDLARTNAILPILEAVANKHKLLTNRRVNREDDRARLQDEFGQEGDDAALLTIGWGGGW